MGQDALCAHNLKYIQHGGIRIELSNINKEQLQNLYNIPYVAHSTNKVLLKTAPNLFCNLYCQSVSHKYDTVFKYDRMFENFLLPDYAVIFLQ